MIVLISFQCTATNENFVYVLKMSRQTYFYLHKLLPFVGIKIEFIIIGIKTTSINHVY